MFTGFAPRLSHMRGHRFALAMAMALAVVSAIAKAFARALARAIASAITISIIAVLGLSFTPTIAAAACFEPSPLLPRGADPYTELVPTYLSREQRDTVKTFLQSLRGRWRGDARGYFCTGTTHAPQQKDDNASIAIDFDANGRDTVIMNATLSASDHGVTRSERLQLLLGDSSLRVDGDNAASASQILSATSRSIAFAVKNRRAAGAGVAEVHRTITISHTQLSVEFTVYSQGGLSSSSRWTASRR